MRQLLIVISISLIFFSCQEEGYDLQIRNSDPILIVDARVESNTKKVKVNLTESTDFLGDNPVSYVNDAIVLVAVNGGEEQLLEFMQEGDYELDNVEVKEGTQYNLRIIAGEKEYEATTQMLEIVPVNLFFFEETFGFGGSDEEKSYTFNMIVNTDLSETDYYLTEATGLDLEDELNESYQQWDDGAYDSNPALFPYFVTEFYALDSVDVKFSHIPKEAYDFYNSLNEVGGQSPSSLAPANPISNISNGAIGMFGAFATFDTTVVVLP